MGSGESAGRSGVTGHLLDVERCVLIALPGDVSVVKCRLTRIADGVGRGTT